MIEKRLKESDELLKTLAKDRSQMPSAKDIIKASKEKQGFHQRFSISVAPALILIAAVVFVLILWPEVGSPELDRSYHDEIGFYTDEDSNQYHLQYANLDNNKNQIVGVFSKEGPDMKKVLYTQLYENVNKIEDMKQMVFDDYRYLLVSNIDQKGIKRFSLYYFNSDNVYPILDQVEGNVWIEKHYIRVDKTDQTQDIIIPIDYNGNRIVLPEEVIPVTDHDNIRFISNVFLEDFDFTSSQFDYTIEDETQLQHYLNYIYGLYNIQSDQDGNFEVNVNYHGDESEVRFQIE